MPSSSIFMLAAETTGASLTGATLTNMDWLTVELPSDTVKDRLRFPLKLGAGVKFHVPSKLLMRVP